MKAIADAALPYIPHLVFAAVSFVTAWFMHRTALLTAARKAVGNTPNSVDAPEADTIQAAVGQLARTIVGRLASPATREQAVRKALKDSKRPPPPSPTAPTGPSSP